jgi:hypothetical protein
MRLRFRPILMTSLAFILDCLPLACSTGARAGARQGIRSGVVGGMLGETVLALFVAPAFSRSGTAGRCVRRCWSASCAAPAQRSRRVCLLHASHPITPMICASRSEPQHKRP